MPPTTLPRRWNHLKMIRSTLANLRGAGSLANELIQNADDADGARRLVFRFTADCLEVIDDGGFRACEQPNDPHECPWELAGRRACDFHAFRELGGASKADDPTLTGAFGIGFLAVYQITDHPELFSHGIHWTLDEASESVTVCDGCEEPHTATGTMFRLPWAKHHSGLRESLGAETIAAEDRRRLLREFVEQIPRAMIFLRKLEQIEIRDETKTIARFSRSVEGDTVRIGGPAGTDEWLLLTGDFNIRAQELRRRHPLIGRRHAEVRIALRPGERIGGRLYATLPTAIATNLPLHLDASFFPRLDRKGILLESGHEADWNRAAITAAAELLAERIEQVATALGPKPFWSLVTAAHALDRRGGAEAKALAAFWSTLLDALPPASVMWTRSGKWARVDEVVMPPRDPALADLLEDLGIPTVAPLIQSLVPARALGIKRITLERITEGLEMLQAPEGATVNELPASVRSRRRRTALRKELGALVAAREEVDPALRARLRKPVLWEGTDGRFSSFNANWLVPRDAIEPLARFSPHAFVVWPQRDASSRALTRVGDLYTVDQALSHLEEASEELEKLTTRDARTILGWFQFRLRQLTDADVERLAQLPLIPTPRGLRTARETVRAGGFRDPLGLTSVLDLQATTGLDELIAKLGIRKLSFAAYLRDHVATLDQLGDVPVAALIELIRQCATHRNTIDADPALITLLTELPWIPCRDGRRRAPGEVYFSSPLIHEVLGGSPPLVNTAIRPRTAAGDLLRLLGVSDAPRPADVVARITQIVAEPISERRVQQIVAILRHLSTRISELDDPTVAPLRNLAWLPAEDKHDWHAPSELHLTFSRTLFATTGLFIALRRTDQERLRTTLTALGVHSTPSVQLVIDHVINLAAAGQAASPELLRWLNERASDPQIARLSSFACVPTADGGLAQPDRVFRNRHPLVPWRAVLRPGIDRFVDLLDALEVLHDPNASTATDVLLEIAHATDGRQPLDPPTLTAVNCCWGMLTAAADADLDRLAGDAVVPGADGCLYRADAVLLDDLPGVERWLSGTARARLVALDGRQHALARAGVGRLSQHRRGEALASTNPIKRHWIEERMRERRLQLARIVAGEGGDWRGVIELTRDVAVMAVGALTIRYELDGLTGLPPNPSVDEGAFHNRETSELFVVVTDGRPDWQALAQVVRDHILPGLGPGISIAIKTALAAQSSAEADAELEAYPPLRDEIWAEFERAAQEQTDATEPDDTDDDYYDDHEDDGGDDEGIDEVASGARDEADHDGSGTEPDDGDSRDHQHDRRVRTGHGGPGAQHGAGTGAPTQGSVANATGGGGDRSGDHTSGAPGARKNGSAPRTDGSSTNHQLISYVTANSDAADPSSAGSREQQLRDAAGEAGVDLVIAHLKIELADSGAQIEKMPEKNKGYDVLVRDANGKPHRYIEVKSTAGPWGLRGVGLTEPQFSLAREQRDRYWLYVVEHLYQREARLWWIRDPAGRVGYFHYDNGWQAASDGQARVAGAPSTIQAPS